MNGPNGSTTFTDSSNSSNTITVNGGAQLSSGTSSAFYIEYGDLGVDNNDDYGSNITYDNLGNIYLIGADGNQGIPFLVKYTPRGDLVWQKTFSEVNNYYKTGDCVAIDSTGNIYAIVGTDDSVSYSTLIKLTSTGSVIWQRELPGIFIADLALGVSNSIYLSGRLTDFSNDNIFVTKYDTNGSLLWQSILDGDPNLGWDIGQSIAVDSSENSYVLICSGSGQAHVAKYNSSGSLQWQKEISMAIPESTTVAGINVDLNGDIYATGGASLEFGERSVWLLKLDPSGSVIWNRFLRVPGAFQYGNAVAFDSLNNVYLTGETNASDPNSDLLLIKYNSSGNLQWQRYFGGISSEAQAYYWNGRAIDVYENSLLMTGYTYSPALFNAEALIVQLPTDGNLLGTYGDFTYIGSTSTEYVSTCSVTTGTLTISTSSVVDATGSLVVSDAASSSTYYTIFNGTTPKFGGASGYFNNVDAYLTSPNNSGFDFSTGDWTVELFCNLIPVEADILINKAVGAGIFPFQLRIINSRFNARGYNNSVIPSLTYNLGFSTGPTIVAGNWYHVAVARQGSNFYLYVDGILIDLAVSSSNLYYSPSNLSIGATDDGLGLVSGYLDEVRITKGLCRYPNGLNFVVPSSEFPNS